MTTAPYNERSICSTSNARIHASRLISSTASAVGVFIPGKVIFENGRAQYRKTKHNMRTIYAGYAGSHSGCNQSKGFNRAVIFWQIYSWTTRPAFPQYIRSVRFGVRYLLQRDSRFSNSTSRLLAVERRANHSLTTATSKEKRGSILAT